MQIVRVQLRKAVLDGKAVENDCCRLSGYGGGCGLNGGSAPGSELKAAAAHPKSAMRTGWRTQLNVKEVVMGFLSIFAS